MNEINFDHLDNKPLTTLIYGAGAVENAWIPICDIVKSYYNISHNIKPHVVNSFLARLVYLMRFYSTLDEVSENLEYVKNEFNDIKREISSKLKKAQEDGIVKSRPELIAILNKFIPTNSRTAAITTNWDTSVDITINSLYTTEGRDCIVPYHIHGDIFTPELIYLPSEIVREPYRSKEEDGILGVFHNNTYSVIENSNTVILYGISLDPLDAELSQIIAAGLMSPKISKIIVINPCYEQVVERLQLLIHEKFPIVIEAYKPDDLNKCYVYFKYI